MGGLVGIERGMKNHTAGLRTYILVCLGSALVMMTNQYITDHLQAGGDPTRMGAQVISGIGFLGAGTILVTSRNRVRGLTTAAGLWAAACVGLAIGIGFYEGAIAGGIALLAVMTLLRPLKRVIQDKAQKVDIYVVADSMLSFNHFLELCAGLRVNILDLQIDNDTTIESHDEGEIVYFIAIDLNNRVSKFDFLTKARSIAGVKYVEDLEVD
ncbi:MgtC/SapB family protein [Aerococcaceae bacterium WGS1372]